MLEFELNLNLPNHTPLLLNLEPLNDNIGRLGDDFGSITKYYIL